MKKKYLFIILLFTISLSSFGQSIGDFQSITSGTWSSISSWQTWNGAWLPATSYPGQFTGTNSVTIQAGHTITIASNLTTLFMGIITVKGTLTVNPAPSPNEINLDTKNLTIDGGTLNFSGVTAKLTLVPVDAVLSLINSGTITAAPCNNNYEIFINSRKYAACAGGGPGVYTFGEVNAATIGNANAQISNPLSGPVTVSGCLLTNLEGGYEGTEINVTYQWKVRNPNGSTSNLGPAGILANSGIKTSTSFTPTSIGQYLVSLEITTTASATNTETRTFNVLDTSPTITAPVNTAGTTNSGCTSTNVSLGVPITNNNCSTLTITNNAPSAFPIGATIVTWTVTDASGRTATSTQSVTVSDNQVPLITCPIATNKNVNTGACTYTAVGAEFNATATDNCAVTSLTYALSGATSGTGTSLTGVVFNKGITTVTWSATDGVTTTVTCSFTVTVSDNQVPVITCPIATSKNVNTGVCTYTAVGAEFNATVTDNCAVTSLTYALSGATSGTGTSLTGVVFNKGITTVTWSATDGVTTAVTCSFIVTVSDNQVPVITCPANISVNNTPGTCGAAVTYTTPVGTDNCSGTTVTKTAGLASGATFPVGTTINTFEVTDAAGNKTSCSFTITVVDNENPTAPNPAPIVASGSAPPPDITLVINETDNCTANPVVAWVSDSSSGSCPVTVTRIYKVTDNAGNSINVTQTITVNDGIKPIARCIGDNILVVTLDGVTGQATILASQINNGSTDNCGTITLSLNKYTFGCNDVGVNTVILTVTDSQGNSDTCATKIRVDAPIINSGTFTGYNVQTKTAADATDVIEITACPVDIDGNTIQQDVTLSLTGIDPSLNDKINRWEYSTNGGVTWATITGTTNTTNTYTVMDVQVTTLVRVVINVGDCEGFSPIAIITVIPPDIPPNIINGTASNTICLGTSVSVVVESEFGVGSAVNQGGLFNTANLDQLGWKVDGEAEMSAGGDNGKNTYWKETNGPTAYNGRCYDSNDMKFAIVAGIPQYVDKPNDQHLITPKSTLETPIFSTLGLTTMQLEFDQAYYLEAGAWIKIEISTDGGTTYSVELDPGAAYDYTGPSSNSFTSAYGCIKGPLGGALVNNNHVSIDLQEYIGLTNLRIRFTYYGTANSAWAIDNIQIPNKPINEVIEWTDDYGVVVATGSTVAIKPVTPGIQNYGATSLINGCRSNDIKGTEFIKIDATLAYAGKNIAPIIGECGEDTVNLSAYDNTLTAQENYDKGVYNNNYKVPNIAPMSPDYPPTGKIGTWSVASAPVACTGTTTFSDINDPNATFTGKPGTYKLAWTVNGCVSTVDVIINSCDQIDFDGINDYITFKDNYDREAPFSIEMWVKAGDLAGTQALLSKRDANDLASGYDLRLNGGSVEFHWGATSYISTTAIDATTWHHIAVTFNGSTYKLYLDGVEKANANGTAPTKNSMQCMLGAMDQANNAPNKPINYYHGWIDELRIWNKALNIEHIRQMMNQEIKLDGGDDVMGEIIPIKIHGPDLAQNGTDDDKLLWSNLDGYYRMTVNCGYLSPYKGSLDGRLRNIYSAQPETAPLPYKSANDGQWSSNNTWAQPVVWYTPNSTIFGTKIDWNIVQTSHNINSGDKDITLLGLISTAGKLTIADPTVTNPIEKNDGQGLFITHYLKLDGNIDLVGESQLVEKRWGTYDTNGNFTTTQFSESILHETSSGYIERDQQGKKNSFNYNYWSSPVSTIQTVINNTPHSIAGILRDGTNSAAPKVINFGGSAFYADGDLETPIKTSNRWIWSYNSQTPDSNSDWQNYFQWNFIQSFGLLKVGEGFTMKGTGGKAAIDATQNYVFIGKPNSGTITLNMAPIQTYLVGNPYPSAIDANEFIKDNLAGRNAEGKNVFNGALYFWDHFGLSNNHNLAQYEGGYATYTLTGGVPGINNSSLTLNDGVSGLKTPGRYIPVGQGFFVDGDLALTPAISGTTATVEGGKILFKNSQRVFVREAPVTSLFMKSSGSKNAKTTGDSRLKIRLGFDSAVGAHRQLLAGADSNSTSQFDIGYDAQMFDTNANDMYWELGDLQLVIQAVPNFSVDQIIPFGVVVQNQGKSTIKIDALENIPESLQIYVHDNVTGIYHDIKSNDFPLSLAIGEYNNRFSLRFTDKTLNVDDFNLPDGLIVYFKNTDKILNIENNLIDGTVNKVYLFNILGQNISNWDVKEQTQTNIQIPIKNVHSGVYIVKLKTTEGDFSKKIIIQ